MAYTANSWSRIIGLDLSKQTFSGCVLSGEGFTRRKNFHGSMKQDETGYGLLKETCRKGDLVMMEAGNSSFSLARFLIANTEAETVVLNPAQLRIVWDSQKKTDKADAMKLACIGRDMRPEAWPVVSVPTDQEQAERAIASNHVYLAKLRTMEINRLHALFNNHGYPDISKADLKENMDYRHNLVEELLSGQAAVMGRLVNERLDILDIQQDRIERELIGICLAHPLQALAWISMPGIALVNTATLIAYVGDGSRFSKPGQLINYAGLSPKMNQSGTVNIHGKITKKGQTCIRRSLVQGAHSVISMKNKTCPLSKFAYHKSQQIPFKGKVAVAVAAKQLRTGLALLHHNDIYIAAKEDGYKRLKAKLRENKLSALAAYLPQ